MNSFIKVFAIIYFPIAIVALLLFNTSDSIMLDSAREELLMEMKSKWAILTSGEIPEQFQPQFHNRMQQVSEKTQLRVTVINAQGKVLDDSYIDPDRIPLMDNHKDRPEVKEAYYNKEGYALRRSSTAKIEMIYYAATLNERLIVRIAYPATYLSNLKREFNRKNFLLSLAFFVIIAVIAVLLARGISIPVQKLDYIADRIEADQKDVIFPQFSDPTMSKIGGLIFRIYKTMNSKQALLEQEQEKLNHIFSILEEGIILLNEENQLLHYNEKAENYLGIALSPQLNVIGDISDFEVINFFSEILQSQKSCFWKTRGFKNRIFEVNLYLLPQEKLIVFFDVTEEAKYDEYKSNLVGNISHELRTPLAMIMGYAETILEDPNISKATADRFLQKIYSGSKRINELISDLLELHKLESMKEAFHLDSPSSIIEIKEELGAHFSSKYPKRLHFETSTDSVTILYEHLQSIFSNLIENAMKYSKGEEVYVSVQKEGSEITIQVEDEGPAIPIEIRDRIFERFYTVSESRNKGRSGTGLGLSIVKHIAQIYSGTVTLTQGSKKGNLFSVSLIEKSTEET